LHKVWQRWFWQTCQTDRQVRTNAQKISTVAESTQKATNWVSLKPVIKALFTSATVFFHYCRFTFQRIEKREAKLPVNFDFSQIICWITILGSRRLVQSGNQQKVKAWNRSKAFNFL
jgi:hypothetical protein